MYIFLLLVFLVVGFILLINSMLKLYNFIKNNGRQNLSRQFKKIKQEILNKIMHDFNVPNWNMWDKSTHFIDGQYERLQRAVTESIEVISYDDDNISATIKGSTGNTYSTNYSACSCPDFQLRKLPCKHMYLLCIWMHENNKHRT